MFSGVHVAGNLGAVSRGRVSDHVALIASFKPRKLPDERELPIPKHIATSAGCKHASAKHIAREQEHPQRTRPQRRLERCKYLTQEANMVARDLAAFTRPREPRALLFLARSLARAARRQDCQCAELLLATHEMAAGCIMISGNRLQLLHPASFQHWANKVQLRAANLDRAEVHARLEQADIVGSRAPLRQQLKAIERRARLRLPFSRRLIQRAAAVEGQRMANE